MSYGSPSLENDIRSRALAVAEVLAATGNAERYDAVRKHFQEQVSAVRLPPDQMTWFAIQRVAVKLDQPAVFLMQEGTPIPAGALVLVSPAVPVPTSLNDATLRALRAASFIAAPAAWGEVLRQARLPTFCVDEEPGVEASSSPSRSPRP